MDIAAARPKDFASFIGQEKARANLEVFMSAARDRGEVLDHILFYGPPGLGKTTLAGIVATEMRGNMRATSAPVIQKPADLMSMLVSLDDGDVLFIDEIHRLPAIVEECLYSAMEDRRIDIMIGEGQTSKPVSIDLPKFTLVGATTRLGSISNPLRDRFGIVIRLEFYSDEELRQVVVRSANIAGSPIDDASAIEIAKRSRGTPRVAGRLFRRVGDFAQVEGDGFSPALVDRALKRLDVDASGLDAADMKYLTVLAQHFRGGPAGLETMSISLAEPKDTVEDVIEPFLIRLGLISRGQRGRSLTDNGWRHLGLEPPKDELAA